MQKMSKQVKEDMARNQKKIEEWSKELNDLLAAEDSSWSWFPWNLFNGMTDRMTARIELLESLIVECRFFPFLKRKN